MKVYNTETRNDAGEYYRHGDWGTEVDDPDFLAKKKNFTDHPPPPEAFDDIPVDWDGKKWILDPAAMQARADADVKAGLVEIDLKSIRSLREWVSRQTDAPAELVSLEAEAVADRAKLTITEK